MKNSISRLAALIAFLAMACVGGTQAVAAGIVVDHNTIDAEDNIIPQEWLDKARALNVSFGHQSVGNDVLQGLEQLAQQNPTRYASTIMRNPTANWFSNRKGIGGIGQYYIGVNGDPEGKMRDFAQKVASHGGNIAVAMMKICYVDLGSDNPDGDPQQVFATYRDTMESLERDHPAVRFVWWTEPITRSNQSFSPKYQQYNSLVRAYAAAHDKPLFDIADIESHDPSGTSVRGYMDSPAMYSAYTSDGGHLNTTGQLRVARAWWWLLASLAGWSENASSADADASRHDCLFDWAEAAYPAMFAPAGAASQQQAPYYYRHYPATNNYLGVSSSDNHVYYLDPDQLLDMGAKADWLTSAGCN